MCINIYTIYNTILNTNQKKKQRSTKKMFELESSVNLQNTKSNSLRTTLPIELVKILKLKDKDKLVWHITTQNDELQINVTKK